MAGERVKLQVQGREARGSAASRRLRAQGHIPGVLYGDGKDAYPFSIDERELRKALSGDHGLHAILDVVLEGQQRPHHAVLKDHQLHPANGRLLHVDLQEVRLDKPIQAQVVVELVGVPEGVTLGGVLSQVVREITVEALPMEVPDRLPIDVSSLGIGDSIRVSALPAPPGVKILDDGETILATVTPPTRVELPEEVVAEEEAAAEEAPAEAEAAAAEPGEPGAEASE